VRVIAGRLGGRLFDSPGTERTHPMSDKMRGALFNILGDIEDLRVFDAFAGTGALSFEAVSRGAAQAVATEVDSAAQRVIAANIKSLQLGDHVQLVCASAEAWLQRNLEASFDIVLCDPPYTDLQVTVLERLAEVVAPGGLLVLSWPAGIEAPSLKHLSAIEQRAYGDAQLIFYRRAEQ
jgi:16S rRNA (guanine966-N2)-methyltransferase